MVRYGTTAATRVHILIRRGLVIRRRQEWMSQALLVLVARYAIAPRRLAPLPLQCSRSVRQT